MILCISVLSVVISPFSFLILLIWFFYLCFLMSLANGLSILFIFLKNQLLALLIFAMVSFVSFGFISVLIFMISSLLLTSVSSFLLYLVASGVELDSTFTFSLVSRGQLILICTFPQHCFYWFPENLCIRALIFICFHAFWFLLWFLGYSEVLFILHMFVFLIVFFPCSWHLILPHCDQKRGLKWFFFLI